MSIKSEKAKFAVTVIVFVLILAVLGGLCYSVITGIPPQDWGKEDNSGTVEDAPVTDGEGNEMTADVNPMPSTMIFSQDAMYGGTSSSYSVSVEATVDTLFSESNGINWSVKWKDENSEWATGKNVNDYVTIYSRIGSDDVCNSVCMITCTQAFGETIILQASLVNHPYIPSVTCEIEFRQRVIGYDIEFYDGVLFGYHYTDEIPEGATIKSPKKTTNFGGLDMFLFNYGGTTGYETTMANAFGADGAPAINAHIVPIYDTYTIEDETLSTQVCGITTESFNLTLGIEEPVTYNGSVCFTSWLYNVYTTFTNSAGDIVRNYVVKNVYAFSSQGSMISNVNASSDYAYLCGVYNCIKNNEGIWRYQVRSESDFTGTYIYTFDLGYTESSYQTAWNTVVNPNAISLQGSVVV